MIMMSAFMRGMIEQVVDDAVNNLTGHIQVHAPAYRDDPVIDNSMSLPSAKLRRALQHPAITAWAARIRVPAVIVSESESTGITLIGIDPAKEKSLSFIGDAVKQGRYLKDTQDKGLLLGKKLAERLETKLGRRVVIMSQDKNNEIADRGYRIVGIFDAKLEATETAYVFTGRGIVQKMLGIEQQLSEIGIKATDRDAVAQVLANVRAAAPKLDVQPWNTLEPILDARVRINNGFTIIWNVVVFVAMGFGLINTLLMAVFERTREFGLFQALGMKPRYILGQVLCEAIFLLIIGLMLGNILSWATILALPDGIDISGLARGAQMVGLSNFIPLIANVKDVAIANLMVVFLGIVASLYPAWRAARYVPVDAITRV